MAKQKREINEEFADVWSEIVSERVEVVKLPTAQISDEILKRGLEKAI